jgi:hypothetical protein
LLFIIIVETIWHQTNGRNGVRVLHGRIHRQNGDVIYLHRQRKILTEKLETKLFCEIIVKITVLEVSL